MPKERKSLEPFLKDSVEFYDHQVDGVRIMIPMRSFLLADDMGLGKSLQSIVVACVDMKAGRAERVLIVSPVSLKGNWFNEWEKFTRVPATILGQRLHPKIPDKLVSLGPAKRSEQIAEYAAKTGPRVLIANYEQVKPHINEFNKLKFDIVIFDECHYLKNPKSSRTIACHKLKSRRTFMLSGTPMLNQVDELWGTLHMIDQSAYPLYWSFVNRYCVFGGYKDKQIVGVKNEQELNKRLRSVMIRRLKKDVLDLPEVQIITRKVTLADEQREIYNQVVDDLVLDNINLDAPEEIDNALTKMLRLKQICGSTFDFTGEDISAKLDMSVEEGYEILRGDPHKLVVFTQFRSMQEKYTSRITKVLSQDKNEPFKIFWLNGDVPAYARQGVVDQWAAFKGRAILVCMLQVAGIGLNMTAARHAQFLDKLYVPGLNQQAIDRLHRIGASETQPIQVYEYLCKKTVELRVEEILRSKSKLFGTVVNTPDFKRALIAMLLEKADEDVD